MARNITVYFTDGSRHEYKGVPDDVTPEQVAARVRGDFETKQIRHIERTAAAQAPEPERTIGGYAKEALKGLVPGLVGLGETAITGAAALLPEEAERAVRKPVEEFAAGVRETFAPAPGYEDTAVRKVSEAVGSTLPFLPLGALGVAGRVAATGLGVSAGAGEARQRAEQEAATEGQRAAATALGIVPGALESLPPIRILRRFGFGDEAIAEVAGVAPALGRIAKSGGEEALQEASSQVLQNLIAKGVYKPDEAVFGGVGEAAALGGGAGAVISAIAELALGRRLRGSQEEPTTEEEEEIKKETEEEEVTKDVDVTEPPAGEEPPAPALTREELLGELEEVAEPEDEAAQKKFEETIAKIKGEPAEGKAEPTYEDLVTQVEASRKRPAREGEELDEDILETAFDITKPAAPEEVTTDEEPLTDEEVVTYDDLERQQIEAATKGIETEAEDVSAPDEQVVEEAKRGRRRKRVDVSVSGEPASTVAGEPSEIVGGRVDTSTDTAARVDAGKEPSSVTLGEKEPVGALTPQEQYDSLQRRLEGLVNARRILAFNANKIRTVLKGANPTTNPEDYVDALNAAETYISQFETAAEERETGTTTKAVDVRERNLKLQEANAIERAQRQIAQNKIAEDLRETADRREEAREQTLLPKYAVDIRDILDEGRSGGLNDVTKLLVEKRAATNIYPGTAGAKYRDLFQIVARKLQGTDFSNVKVQTELTVGANPEVFKRLMKEGKLAEYDPADNTLYIRRDKVNGRTIQHELIHAGTVQTIRRYQLDGLTTDIRQAQENLSVAQKIEDAATRKRQVEKAQARLEAVEQQKVGVERLTDLYQALQEQGEDVSLVREFPKAFENIYDFLAYGLTNPELQFRLAQLEVSTPIGRKNIWTEFVKAIAKIFNVRIKSEDGTSALDELGQAFSEILAAPTKEGVTGVSPLAEKEAEPKKRKKAEKAPKPDINPYEESRKSISKIEQEKLSLKGLVEDRMSSKGVEEFVRNYQDRQRPLLSRQRDLDRANLIIWAPASDKGNAIAAANDESAGRSENNEKVIAPLAENLEKAIRTYAAKVGVSVDEALARLGTYFTAEANEVRRLTIYWREKPLKTTPTLRVKGTDKLISYAQYREMLIDSVLEGKLDDASRDAIYNKLLQLAGVEVGPNGELKRTADAEKYEDLLGASYGQKPTAKVTGRSKDMLDFKSPYYDNIKDWGYEKNKSVIRDMEKDMITNGIEIRAVKKAMLALDETTRKFNEGANHLTQPAKNLIKLYGWGDKYVPLVGKTKSDSGKRDQFIYMNTVPNEAPAGFGGRPDTPDNPLLMTIINAGKAATRDARSEIVPTLVNLMKPHPKTGQKYVEGEMVGVIKFKDRYKGEVDFNERDSKTGEKKWVGRDKFYNHLDNGDIEVWKVQEEDVVKALRPDWEPSKTGYQRTKDFLMKFTSLVGQGHTRYQVKFAPYDFPRNVFANAGAIYAELGPERAGKYFAGVNHQVFVRLRLPQMWRVATARLANDWKAIEKMGGYNEKTGVWKDPFIRDTYKYLKRGGMISITRSWQTQSKLEELLKDINKSDIRTQTGKFVETLNSYFDRWIDMFELVARVEAYRTAKSYGENVRKMSEVESELYGVSFAKNLANFEKRSVAELPNALYAFWSASATGAVRAVEALAPAFRGWNIQVRGGLKIETNNLEKVLNELPDKIKNDPEAKAAYAKRYMELRRNAVGAMGVYAGVGYFMYMVALSVGGGLKDLLDDDEEPTNVVAEDPKELWTRNMRFPLQWLGYSSVNEKYLQIPWGFGTGAFAALGAQVAALTTNGQTWKDFAGNTATIATDSFLPLPFARFNPFTDVRSGFNWMISSMLPTTVRPVYELNTNMSGLGQSIYRSYYNRFGPAYAGSENVDEMYRQIALLIRDSTLGKYQPDPNQVRYVLTSYVDGIAAMNADIYNVWLTFSAKRKDFDPKTDLFVIDNFIGNKVSPSLVKFDKANTELESFKRRYDSFVNDPNPRKRQQFLERYPDSPAIIAAYNARISDLREFREKTVFGEVYADTPQERKDYKKKVNEYRDQYMNQVTALYELVKDKID